MAVPRNETGWKQVKIGSTSQPEIGMRTREQTERGGKAELGFPAPLTICCSRNEKHLAALRYGKCESCGRLQS